MSNPKIALIPSGYKTGTPYGTVYSILPNDASQDFRLDRASIGTRVRKDSLIEETIADTPRLDWLNGNCPSLLRECQRTNLIRYSEDFTQANWSKTDTTVTADFGVAPNGTYTADKLTFTTSNDQARAEQTVSGLTSGANYVLSFYIKSLGADVTLRIGTSASSSGEFTDIVATNEWQRFEWTALTSGTSEFPRVQNISGISGTEILVWGCQYEAGVGATSYIPTTTTFVTRNLDDLECTTTYTVGADATWYFDFEAFSFDSSFRQLFLIRNSAFTQYLDMISYESGGVYYMRVRASSNGGIQNYLIAFGEDAILNFTRNKVAVRLYDNNFDIYVNGVKEYSGTASIGNFDVLNGLDILNDFGASSTAPSYRLYDFRVYDQSFTTSELEQLTTL